MVRIYLLWSDIMTLHFITEITVLYELEIDKGYLCTKIFMYSSGSRWVHFSMKQALDARYQKDTHVRLMVNIRALSAPADDKMRIQGREREF